MPRVIPKNPNGDLEVLKIVQFVRKKDYNLIKELGRGACGITVLLHDEAIDESFVCKKYSPFTGLDKEALFKNFIIEIKLLHLINHPNIVRVFNYHIYSQKLTGYILMEFVDGNEIDDYLKKYPENINEIFLQVIDGFSHLEIRSILHRDIRPQNILVDKEGVVKIIDFGFGKQIQNQEDFDKSISLNWWCEVPSEFKDKKYDYKTEIYFVGKLFEQIIQENNIEHFQYISELQSMCSKNPNKRIASFGKVKQSILENQFFELEFSEEEREAYRSFANGLAEITTKIENNSKYYDEVDKIQQKLEELYKRVMLEEYLPSNSDLIGCFISGAYYYSKRTQFEVYDLKRFIELLRHSSKEKKNIVMSNLTSRLNACQRYTDLSHLDDEIPF